MTAAQQRDELHRQIWQIANDVRGTIDGWDFKQYVLGALFYRFISENFANYMQGGDPTVKPYADYTDQEIDALGIKDDTIKTKGYFIYPSQLFCNIVKNAPNNDNLNTDLKHIFDAIESSAQGYASEDNIKGLFGDFDTTATRLGKSVKDKNQRLTNVLQGIARLNFNGFDSSQIDLFGDAYEFLISNYAANAGKSGGEYFTPQSASKLLARLALHGQEGIAKVYDPACGSGSLLLQVHKQCPNQIADGFFGQEINHTTHNLARMNLFLHNINYDKFHITYGDTLTDPQLQDDRPFDVIVSNPPYSTKWIGEGDPTLINDDRFAPAGVLAPKSKADFAFILHSLHYLSATGRAAIVCFPGIFYRGGAEAKIRAYLVKQNVIEAVISLTANLFFGASIAVNILVLSKAKKDDKILMIDASELFTKQTKNNTLSDDNINTIVRLFADGAEVPHQCRKVAPQEIAANDYNLSVSSYITPKDTSEKIDIDKLNADIAKSVATIDTLRKQLDTIIAEIHQ